jgi:hypothetical protein
MSTPEKSGPISAIVEAIRAKRERKTQTLNDIARMEADLIADIETFDLDAAERRARREYLTNSEAGMSDPRLVFPEIAPPTSQPDQPAKATADQANPSPKVEPARETSSLLDQLRQQAALRQAEMHSALAERTAINESIDQALKHLFFFLHEFVQQLNIVKPAIPRVYSVIEQTVLNELVWQEGFADYRTQSQASGALVELVSFSYHLNRQSVVRVERDGPSVERFRSMIFDYGLPFTCKEFKNDRAYVERAEFDIRCDVSVSARWRADFAKGEIVLETRNLERLGSALYSLRPQAVDQAMLDDFGRLVLAQPNHFRELAKRI